MGKKSTIRRGRLSDDPIAQEAWAELKEWRTEQHALQLDNVEQIHCVEKENPNDKREGWDKCKIYRKNDDPIILDGVEVILSDKHPVIDSVSDDKKFHMQFTEPSRTMLFHTAPQRGKVGFILDFDPRKLKNPMELPLEDRQKLSQQQRFTSEVIATSQIPNKPEPSGAETLHGARAKRQAEAIETGQPPAEEYLEGMSEQELKLWREIEAGIEKRQKENQ